MKNPLKLSYLEFIEVITQADKNMKSNGKVFLNLIRKTFITGLFLLSFSSQASKESALETKDLTLSERVEKYRENQLFNAIDQKDLEKVKQILEEDMRVESFQILESHLKSIKEIYIEIEEVLQGREYLKGDIEKQFEEIKDKDLQSNLIKAIENEDFEEMNEVLDKYRKTKLNGKEKRYMEWIGYLLYITNETLEGSKKNEFLEAIEKEDFEEFKMIMEKSIRNKKFYEQEGDIGMLYEDRKELLQEVKEIIERDIRPRIQAIKKEDFIRVKEILKGDNEVKQIEVLKKDIERLQKMLEKVNEILEKDMQVKLYEAIKNADFKKIGQFVEERNNQVKLREAIEKQDLDKFKEVLGEDIKAKPLEVIVKRDLERVKEFGQLNQKMRLIESIEIEDIKKIKDKVFNWPVRFVASSGGLVSEVGLGKEHKSKFNMSGNKKETDTIKSNPAHNKELVDCEENFNP